MAAIYQWIEGGEVVFTTTLYPAEIEQDLTFNIDVNYIQRWEHSIDSAEVSFSFIGASKQDVLIIADPAIDSAESSFGFFGVIDLNVLISTETDPDSAENNFAFFGASVTDLLIRSYIPEQNLQLSIDISASDFTKTVL